MCVVVCFGGGFLLLFFVCFLVDLYCCFFVGFYCYLFIYLFAEGGGGVDVGYVLACYFFPFVCMSLLVFNL